MKLFKVTFQEIGEHTNKPIDDKRQIYVIANSWEQVGKVYENALLIELIPGKVQVLKETA